MAKFKPYRKKQSMLLPPSLEDYVPASHLSRVVDEVVEALDTKKIAGQPVWEDKYSHLGQNTYHPKISESGSKWTIKVIILGSSPKELLRNS